MLFPVKRLLRVWTEGSRFHGAPEKMKKAVEQLKDEQFKVLFIGPYNAGKSTLVNALVGRDEFQTGPVPTTDKVQSVTMKNKSCDITFVDTPGTEAPSGKITKRLHDAIGQADLVVAVLSQDQSEQHDQGLWDLLKLAESPILAVINAKGIDPEQGKKHADALRAFAANMGLGNRMNTVVTVDAESARKGRVEGKPVLVNWSGFNQLKIALDRIYDEVYQERKQRFIRLAHDLAESLRVPAREDSDAAVLWAEAMVCARLAQGGRSLLLPQGARLKSGDLKEVTRALKEDTDICEIRPAGYDTLDILEEDWTIVDLKEPWYIPPFNPFIAVAGIEFRGAGIRRRGLDMAVVGCEFRSMRDQAITLEDRADAMISHTRFLDMPKAVNILDRSGAWMLDCSFIDVDTTGVETGQSSIVVHRPNYRTLHTSTRSNQDSMGFRIERTGLFELPDHDTDLLFLMNGYVGLQKGTLLRMYDLDGKMLDQVVLGKRIWLVSGLYLSTELPVVFSSGDTVWIAGAVNGRFHGLHNTLDEPLILEKKVKMALVSRDLRYLWAGDHSDSKISHKFDLGSITERSPRLVKTENAGLETIMESMGFLQYKSSIENREYFISLIKEFDFENTGVQAKSVPWKGWLGPGIFAWVRSDDTYTRLVIIEVGKEDRPHEYKLAVRGVETVLITPYTSDRGRIVVVSKSGVVHVFDIFLGGRS